MKLFASGLALLFTTVSVNAIRKCSDKNVVITFDDLATGTKVDESMMMMGVRFGARKKRDYRNNPDSPFDDGMIFDTRNPTGGDDDLGEHPELKQVFIISEDGDSSDPDDEANGGQMEALFTKPSTMHSITLLDMDRQGGKVYLYGDNGRLLKHFRVPNMHDGAKTILSLDDTEGVMRLLVDVKTSGAIDDIAFTQCIDNDPDRNNPTTGGPYTLLSPEEKQKMKDMLVGTPWEGPWPQCLGKTVQECVEFILGTGATGVTLKPATPHKFNFYRIWIKCNDEGKVVGIPQRG